MKKVLVLVLAFALVFSICACGGSGNGGAAEENTYTADNPLVIRFAYVNATEDPAHKAAVAFKDEVESKSEGAVKVELYPNSELGSDVTVLEGVQMDEIQMTAPATSSMAAYDERLALVDLPLLFNSFEDMETAANGALFELYDSWAAESNFKLLGFQFDGTRCVSNNKRPINSIDDFKGLKIRVMESETHINLFKALGASPIPMPYGDVYTGLQQGTIDGQDNPPALTVAGKFNEVQKYYSLTNLIIAIPPVLVNKKVFESYPEDIQEIISSAAEEHLVKWQRAENYKEEEAYIEQIAAGGTKVNEVEDMDSIKEALQPVYDAARSSCGDEVVDELLKACGQ